jgi:hypothetical protein
MRQDSLYERLLGLPNAYPAMALVVVACLIIVAVGELIGAFHVIRDLYRSSKLAAIAVAITGLLVLGAITAGLVNSRPAPDKEDPPAQTPQKPPASSPTVKQAITHRCYYIVIDGFPRPASGELTHSAIIIGQQRFNWDGNDMHARRAYVLKGFQRGEHPVQAQIIWFASPAVDNYAATVTLGDSKYYRMTWAPSTQTYPPRLLHVPIRPISEKEVLQLVLRNRELPSCASVPDGVSVLS